MCASQREFGKKMGSLKRKTVEGAAWMVAMRVCVNLIGILSTVFLARLLTPGDFGVVALAGSAYLFISVIGQFGFDSALIHHEAPTDEHYNSAWTANILVGLTISAIMFAVAKPAAWFFDDLRIENVVYAFSMLSLAKGFENIGVVNFRKSLRFKGDFLYFVLPKLPSAIVAVTFAYLLRSYWALVIGMVMSQILTLIYSHVAQPFRPRLSLKKIGDLLGFSRWIMISNILGFLFNNGVEILLGRLKDASAVGIFGIARQLAYLPSTELLAPINRALFPSFATVSNEPERLRNILSRVLGVTALISIPSAFGIYSLAGIIVPVIFGEHWIEAVPVLSVLGFAGVIVSVHSVFGPLLLARGNPRLLSHATLVSVVVTLPTAAFLIPLLGAVGVAYATLLGSLITIPMLISGVRREVGFGWRDLAACIWRPVTASVLMAAALRQAQTVLVDHGGAGPVVLFELVVLGVIVFSISLVVSWVASGLPVGAEKELWELIRGRLKRD
jgi:O-antigen/teichoic acid export membrane protein